MVIHTTVLTESCGEEYMNHCVDSLRSQSLSPVISRLSWNPKFHYRVYKGTPLIPILNYMNPVHNLPNYFFKGHPNIFLRSTLFFPSRSLTKTLHALPITPRVLHNSFISSKFNLILFFGYHII